MIYLKTRFCVYSKVFHSLEKAWGSIVLFERRLELCRVRVNAAQQSRLWQDLFGTIYTNHRLYLLSSSPFGVNHTTGKRSPQRGCPVTPVQSIELLASL
jgi:hypothetical protein